MTDALPAYPDPRVEQQLVGGAEAVGPGKAVGFGYLNAVEADMAVLYCAQGYLVLDGGGGKARCPAFYDETLNLSVRGVPGPDQKVVTVGAVANPTLFVSIGARAASTASSEVGVQSPKGLM